MLYARAMNDVVWWFGTFAWTVDPRKAGLNEVVKLPMVPFPKQAEVLAWLREREINREDGLIEKSRDFGLTWLCGGYAVHAWLFRSGARFCFGSRKLEYVDNSKDPKTIFYKLRYLVDNLPWWMKPADYLSKYCLLDNKANGCSISGEGGDSIGRGDRATVYFVDEAAFLEHPEIADGALSQTTDCRIDVSTVNGVGNPFYRKRHGGVTPVLRCHWTDDPRKDVAWYENQKRKLDPVTLAQEVDIDYTASVEGICIPAAWIQAAVNLHEKMAAKGSPSLPQTGALRASIDLAGGGANQNVLGFRRGVVLLDPISWRHDSQDWTAGEARRLCEERGVKSLVYDAGGGYGGGIADMAANKERPPRFEVRALNGGDAPSDLPWPEVGDDDQHITSKQKFINGRAERWWLLRERFRKTWEVVTQGKEYPLEELISIPNHTELINDLSKPLAHYNSAGKIGIESKADMKKRGVSSPDFGDMLAQLEAPVPVGEWWNDSTALERLKARYGAVGVR